MNKNNNISAIYRLSPLQEGLLFHTVYCSQTVLQDTTPINKTTNQHAKSIDDKVSSQYTVVMTWQYTGNLNAAALQQAWQYLMKNHDALRSRFAWEGIEQPVQIVHANAQLAWQEVDLSHLSVGIQQEEIDATIAMQRKHSFVLSHLPLMQCLLLKLGDDRYQFIWTHHHILLDGWCLSLLFTELHQYYRDIAINGCAELLSTPLYADYVAWLDRQSQHLALAYWQKQLRGFVVPTPLPGLHNNQLDIYCHSSALTTFQIILPAPELAELQQLATNNGVTLNSVVQFAWSLLLSFYSNENDVVHGTVLSGRPPEVSGIERMLGLFINTVPLRMTFASQDTVDACLKICHEKFQQNNQYAHVGLSDIKEQSELERDLPLFYSVFIFENYPKQSDGLIHGCEELNLKVSKFVAYEQTNYPLTVVVYPGSKLVIEFRYDGKVFKVDELECVAKRYQHLLSLLPHHGGEAVASLDFLFSAEKCAILKAGNNDRDLLRNNKTLLDLFIAQVIATPENLAVICGNVKLTYAQLYAKVDCIAQHVRESFTSEQACSELVVGVCLTRSVEVVAAFLGVMKAGYAYMPLDQSYPDMRLSAIVQEARCRLILTQNNLLTRLSELVPQCRLLSLDVLPMFVADGMKLSNSGCLNEHCEQQRNFVSNQNVANISPLAYVMFTSGSTGKAKGVAIQQSALVNFLTAVQEVCSINERDCLLALTSFSFDISGLEIYLPLINGACCVLATKEELSDPGKIKKLIAQKNISLVQATPATWQMLLAHGKFSGNFKILCGGEVLTWELARQLKACSDSVVNLYGPTETTIWSTYYQLGNIKNNDNRLFVPIGKPLNNTQVYVLDRNLNLLPPGVVGELYIGGTSLARGYFNHSELTAERFIKNPFASGKIYKTGDLVCWLADGNLAYIGRDDFQIKMRGFRIELGEIENVLLRFLGVQQVVVISFNDAANKYLVAYYVAEHQLAEDEMTSYLRSKLPDYMVPSIFVYLTNLPLTVSGKLDRKALPLPQLTADNDYIAPLDELEQQLVVVWQECLHLEKLSVDDDFFRVGGNSILAMQLSYRLSKVLNRQVDVAVLLQQRTVRKLAQVLRYDDQVINIPQLSPEQRACLSFAQECLWFMQQYEDGANAYNVPMIYELAPEIDVTILEKSIHSIIYRQDILRTAIKEDDEGRVYQELIDSKKQFVVKYLTVFSQQELTRNFQADINHVFALSFDYPIIVSVYTLDTTSVKKKYLCVVVHHIAFDGWSADIFLKELIAYYRQWQSGQDCLLPTLTIQYRDFAVWQRHYLPATNNVDKHLSYWREKMSDYVPLSLITDHPRSQEINYAGKTIQFAVGVELSYNLQHIAQELQISLYALLLGAYVLLLRVYSSQDDIVLGIPVANRPYSQQANLIGFFVNMLVLRFRMTDVTIQEYLQQVNQEILEAQAHQELPFAKLVDSLDFPKDLSRHPIFQVTFDVHDVTVNMQSKLFKPYPQEFALYTTAKFDLSLFVNTGGDDFIANISYATSLFTEKTISWYIETYLAILAQLIDFKGKIFNIKYFSTEQTTWLLNKFRATAAPTETKIATKTTVLSKQQLCMPVANCFSGLAQIDSRNFNLDKARLQRAPGACLEAHEERGQKQQRSMNSNCDSNNVPGSLLEKRLCTIFADILGIAKDKIGLQDDFFRLGGDSIVAIRLVSKLNKEFRVNLKIKDIFVSNSIAKLALLLASDGNVQNYVATKSIASYVPFSLADRDFCSQLSVNLDLLDDVYPASYLQMGMLLEGNLDKYGAYLDVVAYKIKSKFMQDKFMAAITVLVKKHELLRASFELHDGIYFVLVHKDSEIKCQIYVDQDTDNLIATEQEQLFVFSQPGLFRIVINDLGDEFVLILSFHHAITDGWSVASCLRELLILYLHDKQSTVTQLHYGEFVANELAVIDNQEYLSFWQDYLTDYVKPTICQWNIGFAGMAQIDSNGLALQQGFSDMSKQSLLNVHEHCEQQGNFISNQNTKSISWKFTEQKTTIGLSNITFVLMEEPVQLLLQLAQDLQISVDTIFLLAYFYTMSFFSNTRDLVIGWVVNNRLEKEGGDTLFGLFLNTIPLRFKLTQNSIHDDLSFLFEQKRELQQYKLLPYGKIKEMLQQKINVYDWAFNFVNFHVLNTANDIMEEVAVHGRTNIPFVLNVAQSGQAEFSVTLSAHSDYISKDYLAYLVGYYQQCLLNILNNRQERLRLNDNDYRCLTLGWHGCVKDYASNKTLHELFAAQVIKTPENIAVVCEGEKLSYRELNNKANQFAYYLRESYFAVNAKEMVGDNLVGLCMERGVAMIVAMLGILKAGGAFLPLDPALPDERIKYILQDAALQFMVTQNYLVERIKYLQGTLIDDDSNNKITNFTVLSITDEGIKRQPQQNVTDTNHAHNLAYVIYTSGSTGKPKGVLIEHRGVVNLVAHVTDCFGIKEHSKVLQFASISFDASIYEIFPTLLSGAQLHLLSKDELLSHASVTDILLEKEIEVAMLPPSVLQTMEYQLLPRLKTLISGGEACTRQIVDTWSPGRKFINAYGPTEVTVSCAMGECTVGESITLGKPLPNVTVYVLGYDRQLLPIGVAGELYVGGVGVARGYLNRPELTQERFIDNPFAIADIPTENMFPEDISQQKTYFQGVTRKHNLKLYRTGDIVRWLPNGKLEYIGRNDFQVKIRGYRIELGEIEAALLDHPAIGECVVVVGKNVADKKLLAYYVTKGNVSIDERELREHLAQLLPGFMLPSYFIAMSQLPLTISGKVDRNSLPKPSIIAANIITPHNELEQILLNLWATVLRLDSKQLSVDADFFVSGGHSLAAIKLSNEINACLHCDLTAATIFHYPSIAQLALFIEENESWSIGGQEYVL